MALFIQDIIDILHEIAPPALAEPWDNVGLLVGDPRAKAKSLLVALDPTLTLLDEALAIGANVIITHHPVIFHPLKSLRTDQPLGHFLSEALKRDIHIIACHTNLDSAENGVSDILAQSLELKQITPLVPAQDDPSQPCGLGRIGSYPSPVPASICIEKLRLTCKAPWLLEAGIRPERVKTIAVCGGSCSEFAQAAMDAGADLFITAEVKHSVARWAEEAGFWIIDGGHFATEQLALPWLQERLQKDIQGRNLDNSVSLAQQHAPLTMA